jgi:hypothetical protein
MAEYTTPRLLLPYPDLDEPADIPADILQLATRLDAIIAREPALAATALVVGETGQVGQVRAGRQLAATDFTALGLSAPAGLWNLSDLTDASGNGRNLTNKGAVPFGVGINGIATTAAVFTGSTAQALYVLDTGAADALRIKTGSWGCWMRLAKSGVQQALVTKYSIAAGNQCYYLCILNTGVANVTITADGSSTGATNGMTRVDDDRWHFVVAATGTPFYGRIDEAFVTADVLSADQVRALYCVRVPHALGLVPKRVAMTVARRRRGAPFVAGDFPTQPVRLHNFTGGALTDAGSANIPLVANAGTGSIVNAGGADGAKDGSYSFVGAHTGMSATDAGLPAALTARSYGCWVKNTVLANGGLIGWGTLATGDARILMAATGALNFCSAGDIATAGFIADGMWHHIVCTEDATAGDGVKRKFYQDGRLVGGSTVMNSVVGVGAGGLRIGSNPGGGTPFSGHIDGAFVCGYVLTGDQVAALYNKSSQTLAPSPLDPSPFIETLNAADVLATFDALDSNHTIDLGVTG